MTIAQEHQPGEQLFVDYGGDPVWLTDRHTSEKRPVWLFVAAWGFSHLLYVEATATQKSQDWLSAHVNALEAFGCAPHAIVPDNTTTAVRRALRYEPQLHPEYRDFAEAYSIAVLPARVRKPREKAQVESAVLMAQRRVLGALRDAVFFSLTELNAAIRAIVAEINAEPFQKREGTRRELFERYERPAAQALPEHRYEYAQWRTSLVHRDHHIEVARGYYSVPYTLVGQRVDVRLGAHLVEIFQHGALIAAHVRVERPYQRRTIAAPPAGRPTAWSRSTDTSRSLAEFLSSLFVNEPSRLGVRAAFLIERFWQAKTTTIKLRFDGRALAEREHRIGAAGQQVLELGTRQGGKFGDVNHGTASVGCLLAVHM